MTNELWPAQLDHVARTTDKPEALADFYSQTLDMLSEQISENRWLLTGPERRLLIEHGACAGQTMHAFRVRDDDQLAALRARCLTRNLPIRTTEGSLFENGFSVQDPDGRSVVFGRDRAVEVAAPAGSLRGRLQHVVTATTDLPAMIEFYRDTLGFAVSDNVHDGDPASGDITATFFRSDPEHHSYAAFRGPENRADHLCFEAPEWNDIRDWADHMAKQKIKLWWGPGRHGPGNNLFFMIEDPEGYKLEISAELEHIGPETPPRTWRHEERTLNLWGNAWMRS